MSKEIEKSSSGNSVTHNPLTENIVTSKKAVKSVTPKENHRRTLSPLSQKTLSEKMTSLGAPPIQGNLFHVERQVEYDGIEMGVLDNGIPYLTESGLARMCDVNRAVA